MEKNSLKYTGLLAFIVWGALLLMHLLPSITMGGRVLRRVDILGDVRRPSKPVSEPDSLLPPPPKVKPAFVDTCRAGMTCIEDYSDSTMRGMTFIVEGRYYFALSDFYSTTKKDYFARAAHGTITIKLTYLFDLKK